MIRTNRGASTLSIITLSIMTLSITTIIKATLGIGSFYVTLSINDSQYKQHFT
jgi:hypothetical protein